MAGIILKRKGAEEMAAQESRKVEKTKRWTLPKRELDFAGIGRTNGCGDDCNMPYGRLCYGNDGRISAGIVPKKQINTVEEAMSALEVLASIGFRGWVQIGRDKETGNMEIVPWMPAKRGKNMAKDKDVYVLSQGGVQRAYHAEKGWGNELVEVNDYAHVCK